MDLKSTAQLKYDSDVLGVNFCWKQQHLELVVGFLELTEAKILAPQFEEESIILHPTSASRIQN